MVENSRLAESAEASPEEACRKELELVNGFIDSVRDYAFITFDLENRIARWNSGAERILGYSENEVLGQSGALFFTPEDRLKNAPEWEVETARRYGRAEDERWHLRKDGSRFWGSGVLSALYDSAGVHRGYAKVFQDLTEQKLADERLRQSEERLRLFSENVLDYALILADTEQHVSGWNPGAERIFGFSEDEALGKPFEMFFTPEDAARGDHEADFRTALSDGRSEMERWMVRKDNSRFWGRWVTTPMRDPSGELRGFTKVLHDETGRKMEHEEETRQALLERSSLQSEIRFKGQELDRNREELRALAGSLLRAQEDESRRIARELHDDFLQELAMLEVRLTQLRKGAGESSPVGMELQEMAAKISSVSARVRDISHHLHPSLLDDFGLPVALEKLAEDFRQMKNHRIVFESPGFPDEIPAEVASAFYRIAQEALMNVVRHAKVDTVQVTLDARGGALNMAIEDSGPGFDRRRTRAKGGLGIISMQERAQLIGANLTVQSEPGGKTIVRLRLPRSELTRGSSRL